MRTIASCWWGSLAGAGAVLALQTALGAQQPPKRPTMEADRDSNSGAAYYYYGLSQLQSNPSRAADAFYWATRLEPGMAEPWYGRWAALLLQQSTRTLGDYLTGESYIAKSAPIQRIDSLRYQALIREPLLYWRLDAVLLDQWLSKVTQGEVTLAELSSDFGPEMAAWWAYGRGRFVEALKQYAIAVARHPKWYGLRAQRARTFLPILQYDSAAAAYGDLLALERSAEEERLVHVYESKEVIHYTIGRIHEQQGDLAGARDAYGRALVENLAFYPAHAALARVALRTGDTTAAVHEYDQAQVVHPEDPGLEYDYGVLLFALKRYDEAAQQLQRAVDHDPDYARPYLPLAYLRENEGKDSVAIAYYRRFIAIAPASLAPQVQQARQRLGELPDPPH
jgi:hypothetical protein